MASYKIICPEFGWPAVTDTGTFATSLGIQPPLQLGQLVSAVDLTYGVGEFVFAYGSNVSAGNLVQFTGSNYGVRAYGSATASIGPVGYAAAAMSATNVWGFVQVRGIFDSATADAAIALGVAFKAGGAVGRVASRNATNVTNQIYGMYNASSNSASTGCSIMLDYPYYLGY